ncbi:MAG: HPF/RaiA family ribosome-associated protein [Bacteroidetes bacterium]|nr:HPF/RaiA family ribosome-associated protein [Bacteroidota bacterium]
MTTNIQSVHFDADKKLIEFAHEKMNKLKTFHDGLINGEVIMRLDKSSNSENKVAEIKILAKGQELFSKNNRLLSEESIDLALRSLKITNQKKHKDKQAGAKVNIDDL